MEKFKVPLIDLKREYTFLKREIKKQIDDCLKMHHWILGEKTEELEKKMARYLGANFAIGVASGTDALILSLRALAIKIKKKEFFEKKDEIITTPLTFIATAEAIIRSGATPVFVDIDSETFNISPPAVEKAISKNTQGIVVVHLYGRACPMTSILKIARKYNLFVVEDCAQSFGAEFKGRKLGTWGDLGAFSFFPSKNLGAYGDAGMVTTNNLSLARLVTYLRNHGQKRRYEASYIGYNSRLDSLQAAILLAKLNYIDRFNGRRIKIAKKYTRSFLKIKNLVVPFLPKDDFEHIFHLYTLRVEGRRRDELVNYLRKKGIEARVYYPKLLSFMKRISSLAKVKNIENTLKIHKEIFSLPIHPFLEDVQVKYVVSKVEEFFR